MFLRVQHSAFNPANKSVMTAFLLAHTMLDSGKIIAEGCSPPNSPVIKGFTRVDITDIKGNAATFALWSTALAFHAQAYAVVGVKYLNLGLPGTCFAKSVANLPITHVSGRTKYWAVSAASRTRNLGTKRHSSHSYSVLPSLVPSWSYVSIFGRQQHIGHRMGPSCVYITIQFWPHVRPFLCVRRDCSSVAMTSSE